MTENAGDLPKVMDCAVATKRLRIAVVYNRLPFPMMRGDQLTVSHLLSFLKQRGHYVDFYTLNTDGAMSARQHAWLTEVCEGVHIYPHGRVRQAMSLLRALFNSQPIQVALFQNSRLKANLRHNVENGLYDIVYVYYLRSATCIPTGFGPHRTVTKGGRRVAAFLAMQLAQSLNMERIFREEQNRFKRIVWRFEWDRVRRFEARVWRSFTSVLLIGPRDVENIKAVCREYGGPLVNNWIYGAHGTDTGRLQPGPAHEIVPGRVVFSGSMAYAPNVQAVSWFVQNCWPLIKAAEPNAELVIQGRDPTSEVVRLGGRDGITVTGTVKDIGQFIRSAAVCVAPIRAAGGMQNKLIEYMAYGKAVVATSIANEGIMAPDDVLVRADEPADIASAVVSLLREPDRAAAIGLKAREFVLTHWTWEAHFFDLEKSMYAALEDKEVEADVVSEASSWSGRDQALPIPTASVTPQGGA